MKYFLSICLLSLALIGCSPVSPITDTKPIATTNQLADSQWLGAVRLMLTNNTSISTPNQNRVELLTEWAKSNGYAVSVSHHDQFGHTNDSMWFVEVNKVK